MNKMLERILWAGIGLFALIAVVAAWNVVSTRSASRKPLATSKAGAEQVARQQEAPLEPDFTFLPSEPEPGQETKFFGKSSGKFVSCVWFVNGKSIATTPDCTTTFDKEGDHEVKFAVTDDSKHTAEKVRTVHVVEPILKPAFKTLREAASGQEVLFANETSGPAKSFEWDFGDGEKSDEKDPSHIFKNEGKTP